MFSSDLSGFFIIRTFSYITVNLLFDNSTAILPMI